jgi:hypothetical protein
MPNQQRKATLERELIDTLASHDFHRRYYELYEATKGRTSLHGDGRKMLEQELAITGYEFTYNKREDSFDAEERVNAVVVSVHAGIAGSDLELFLNVAEGDTAAGGAFSVLALKAARLKDPAFKYNPPYPTICVANRQDVRDALKFAIQNFEVVKGAFETRNG